MIIIQSTTTNPQTNIATEEYLFNSFKEDILFIYRNKPSIIVGKHQNAFSEVNKTYCENNNIEVVRRMSGGGAVYHDLGNLNFTQITSVEGQNKVDFFKFLDPMLQFIQALGVPVKTNERHNIMIEDEKITGTACHTFKSRVMHHGTLLFSADLGALHGALIPDNPNFASKAVKSVPSKVTRLSDHLKTDMKIEGFEAYVFNKYVADKGLKPITLDESIQQEIDDLAKTKYSTWEWNFGYSPKCTFEGAFQNQQLKLRIEKGIITEATTMEGKEVVDLIGKKFI